MNENLYSVSELNQYIKDVLSAGFPQTIWVCGEIQNFRDKKHVYFELVEKDSESHQVKAKINVAIWMGKKAQIQQVLAKSENAFELKDDIEVKLCCNINFWVQGGSLTLVVESIDPVYTLGKLAQERQKLIAKLKAAGTLDKNKQRPLPHVPLNIGLITSDDSAAYHDFISELQKSGYAFKVFLRNTIMQGKKTEKDVCRALEELAGIKSLDAVVITRGGGSVAELSCFDSQMISEAVADYHLPVLSGIGHEINTTVTDLAAHTYAKTPTAIAQFLVSLMDKFSDGLDERLSQILDLAQDRLQGHKDHLKELAGALQNSTRRYFEDHHKRLIVAGDVLRKRPALVIKDSRRVLKDARTNLARVLKGRLQQDQLKLSSIEKVIAFAHPMNTIKRGFSITRTKDGKILRKASQIAANAELTTEIFDSVIDSQVRSVTKRKE